jgi:hypothetical protein
MSDMPLMASKPSDVRIMVVRDSSTSAAREREMSQHFPSLSEMVSAALQKLESEGYGLVDIRYSVIPTGGEGYEHFAMLIGRRAAPERVL